MYVQHILNTQQLIRGDWVFIAYDLRESLYNKGQKIIIPKKSTCYRNSLDRLLFRSGCECRCGQSLLNSLYKGGWPGISAMVFKINRCITRYKIIQLWNVLSYSNVQLLVGSVIQSPRKGKVRNRVALWVFINTNYLGS